MILWRTTDLILSSNASTTTDNSDTALINNNSDEEMDGMLGESEHDKSASSEDDDATDMSPDKEGYGPGSDSNTLDWNLCNESSDESWGMEKDQHTSN